MVVLGGVEPEVDPLLPVPLPAGEDVRLHDVGLPAPVPQKLEVDLVVLRVLRRELRAEEDEEEEEKQGEDDEEEGEETGWVE